MFSKINNQFYCIGKIRFSILDIRTNFYNLKDKNYVKYQEIDESSQEKKDGENESIDSGSWSKKKNIIK